MLDFRMIGRLFRTFLLSARTPVIGWEDVDDAIVSMNRCHGAVISSQCGCKSHLNGLESDEMIREVTTGVESAGVLFLTGSPPGYMLKVASEGIEVGSPLARFLSGISGRAFELLGRKAKLKEDYAIAEVLSCGYYDERPGYGSDAMSARLRALIEKSGARVVVALGSCPEVLLRRAYQIPPEESLYGPVIAGEYLRFFAFLPHPLSARSKSFDACLTLQQASLLRSFLAVTTLIQETADV
jgi:hypothetical protein